LFPFILASFSGILLFLSFPDFNLSYLAFVAFVPLFFALRKQPLIKSFFIAYLSGMIFWWGAIYWLVHVTFLGTVVLIAYLCCYFGVFGVLTAVFLNKKSPMRILWILPGAWSVLEYTRAHLFTGFGWASLGYSQYLNLPFIQVADLAGVYGVSFVIVLVNAGVFILLQKEISLNLRLKQALVAVVVLLAVLFYGFIRLNKVNSLSQKLDLNLGVVQSNIDQELKWSEDNRDFIMARFMETTARLSGTDNPDLIIWPEAALPVVLEEQPRYFKLVQDFNRGLRSQLLLGAVRTENQKYYNSALLLSAKSDILAVYNKLHLVPFGEYIPFRGVFPFLESIAPIGDISPGKDYTLFPVAAKKASFSVKCAVLICFEDLFPELARSFVKQGAGLLVNITNDAWYKKTSAPRQHLQASVFRALENRVFLARSANTGISGFIAPSGKILSLVEKGGENTFIGGFSSCQFQDCALRNTFYTRYGDVFVTLAGVILFVL
jgi:apolipoprotein N-acyltransferase